MTDIILKKLYDEDYGVQCQIKFIASVTFEDFILTDEFWLSKQQLEELAEQLNKKSGKILFGNKKKKHYCEFTTKQSARGYMNINYHYVKEDKYYDLQDNMDISLNTGYVIEPATLDRIVVKLRKFYSEPAGCELSLIKD